MIRFSRLISSTEPSTSKSSAENLLSNESGGVGRWRGKAGEREHVAIIQLDGQHRIVSVDVGNEWSAFIEILVGRSSQSHQRFTVLIPSCSLMNPMESRNETNGNRVRLFSIDDMIASIAEQKWDQIKIICTQPFNQSIAYGLAFIRLGAVETEPKRQEDNGDIEKKKTMSIPALPLQPKKSSDETPFLPGSLFNQRAEIAQLNKESKAIDSSSQNSSSQNSSSQNSSSQDSSSQNSSSRPAPIMMKRQSATQDEEVSKRGVKKELDNGKHTATKKKKMTMDHDNSSLAGEESKKKKKKDQENKGSVSDANVPFDQILNGVHVCLSGFVNPERGILRDNALEMGARYDAQWLSDSTHLVCAFAKTPKREQAVRDGAVVVSADWIAECHSKQRQLSPSRFPPPLD